MIQCHEIITSEQHILSDFLITEHAPMESNILLTRDRGFYKTFFPELKQCPALHKFFFILVYILI